MIWFFAIIGIAAAVYLGILLHAGLHLLHKLLKSPRNSEEWARARECKAFQDCYDEYDHVWARTAFTLPVRGAVLAGEYDVNPAGPKQVVVLCHGLGTDRFVLIKYAHIYYRLGWSVLLYDERYYGRSSGKHGTLGQKETQDLVKVIAYARSVFGGDCRLALHGESMGAATALCALAYERPVFVVADCPFADTVTLMRYLIPRRTKLPPRLVLWLAMLIGQVIYGYDMRKVSPIQAVRTSDVPICLFHGLADTLIPYRHSQDLCQASRNPQSEMHLVEGAKHASSYMTDRTAYEAYVTAFVRKCTREEKEI